MSAAAGAEDVRSLVPEEVPFAARLLARAFHQDAWLAYLYPGLGDAERACHAEQGFRIALAAALPCGHVYAAPAAPPGAPPLGVAIFLPPGRPRLPLGAVLRAGGFRLWSYGLRAIRRMVAVQRDLDARHPAVPHWESAAIAPALWLARRREDRSC